MIKTCTLINMHADQIVHADSTRACCVPTQ